MNNLTIHAHLTREGGSDYVYSFLELTEEQTQQIANILHIGADDVADYINIDDYFEDHGETRISEPYLDKYNPWNLMADVSGRYTYPEGFTIEVYETFENLENCAEALSYCDMYTLKQLAKHGGKALGELTDRLLREQDKQTIFIACTFVKDYKKMKRHFFAGDCNFYIYLIDSISVSFKDNNPRVRVFSSKKARDAYVKETSGACALPARIAHYWVGAYTWEYAHTVEDYLQRYPQNDLRSL